MSDKKETPKQPPKQKPSIHPFKESDKHAIVIPTQPAKPRQPEKKEEK
ncbi:MAG: hypothetical protein ACYC57_08195 [Thermoleophilia bacterium]